MNKFILFIKNCFSRFKAGLNASFTKFNKWFCNRGLKCILLLVLFLCFFSFGTCYRVVNYERFNSSSSVEFAEPTALTDRQQIDNSNNKFFNDTLIGSLIDLGSLIIPSQDRVYSLFEVSCGSFYLFNYNNDYRSDYADSNNTEIYDSFGLLYPYALDGNTVDYHFMQLYLTYSNNDTVWFSTNGTTYNIATFNPAKSPLHVNLPLEVTVSFSKSFLDSDGDGRYTNVLTPFRTCESRVDYTYIDGVDRYVPYTTKKINTADKSNVCQIRFDYVNYYLLPEMANSGLYYENYTPVFSVNLSDIRYDIYDNGYSAGEQVGYNNGLRDAHTGANPIYGSIKDGISNFFDISLFGGFQVGHLLLIGLGIVMIKIFITQFLT